MSDPESTLRAEVESYKAQAEAATAAAAAAQATIAALMAQLAAQRPPPPQPGAAAAAAAGAAAARPLLSHAGVAAVLAAHAPVVVPSPSKVLAAQSILVTLGAFDLSATPLSESLRPLAVAGSLARWHGLSADQAVDEEEGYPRATASVPAWICARTRSPSRLRAPGGASRLRSEGSVSGSSSGSMTAATLFLARPSDEEPRAPPKTAWPVVPGATVPWSCQPELLTAVREPFHPAFNGEVKPAHSSGDTKARAHLFDEVVTYCMLGMLGSFFRDVPRGTHRFFRAPPHAFALAAFPHVGYLLAVEWAGRLLTSVVSEPFFVGSEAHAAAVASLPDCDFSEDFYDMAVDSVRVASWPEVVDDAPDGPRPAVIWRIEEPAGDAAGDAGAFFKILRGDAFDAAFFRRLAATYAALRAAVAEAGDARPAEIVPTELLFGAGEVCVRMPWARGRDAALGDLGAGGVAVAPVARAVVWLARRGLLYVDLREPNVRIGGGGGGGGGAPPVALIDYDDMVLLEGPPATVDELRALLQTHGAAWAGRADVPGARPAVVTALAAAWHGEQSVVG
jgi:hypothetical protein